MKGSPQRLPFCFSTGHFRRNQRDQRRSDGSFKLPEGSNYLVLNKEQGLALSGKLVGCSLRLAICIWQLELQYSLLGNTDVKKKKTDKGTRFSHDKRRKHRHWQVTVYYHDDNEKFARVYIDRDKAVQFAERQKKSPLVRTTRVLEVD